MWEGSLGPRIKSSDLIYTQKDLGGIDGVGDIDDADD
jgi:hypothetical protein